MKKLLTILLASAMLMWGGAASAEQDAPGGDMSRFSIPRIPAPTIPVIEVPEIPEIDVPEVPTAAPTEKPKIKAPEIPGVEVSGDEIPQPAASVAHQVEAALEALGVKDYRALYDALSRGEVIGDGSRGDAARGLQQLLAAFGQAVKADGIVGPRTIAALNAVQDQFGLRRTGSLDAEGFAALLPLLMQPAEDSPAP
jgi:hypothetical protein